MKLTLEQGAATSLLKSVGFAAARNNPVPIWACVLLKAEDDKLHATCTDGDMWISNSVSAEIDDPGSICIDADILSRFVGALPAGSVVSIATEKQGVRLRCGRSTASFGGLPAEDFPMRHGEYLGEGAKFESASSDIAAMLSRTVDAVSTDSVKYQMCGVNLRIDGKLMYAEATNGFFAMRQTMPAPVKKIPSVLIPTKSVNAILKILSAGPTAQLIIDPAFLSIECSGQRVITKLIEGQFPTIENGIPKEWDTTVEVEIGALKDATSRIGLFASDKDRVIAFKFGGNQIEIENAQRFRKDHEGSEVLDAKVEGPEHTRGMAERTVLGVMKPVTGKLKIHLPTHQGYCALFLDTECPGWLGAACSAKL